MKKTILLFCLALSVSGAFASSEVCKLDLTTRAAVVALTSVLALTPASAGVSVSARSSPSVSVRSSSPSPRVSTPSPTVTMRSGTATGRMGNAITQKYNSGQSIGRYGGTTTKSVFPEAARAPTAAVRANSTRGFSDSRPAQDRLRANISPPPRAPRVNYYSVDNGYLNPSAHNLVFSPAYFYYPFNIWHPHVIAHGVAVQPQGSDFGDFSNDVYSEGEVGSPALDEAPEDVQAELRLMQTKQNDVRPVDPKIVPLAESEDDWNAKVEPIKAQLADLHAKMGVQQKALDLHEAVEHDDQLLLSAKADLEEAAKNIQAAQDQDRQATKAANDAKEVLANAEKASWTCWIFGNDGLFCHWATSSENALYDQAHVEQVAKSEHLEGAQANQENVKEFIDTTTENRANTQGELAQQSEASGDDQEITARMHQLQTRLSAVEEQALALTGFVNAPIPNVSCATPLLYRSVPGLAQTKNALLGNVEAELIPNDATELRVCLDDQQRLSEVHIFADNKDTLHSQIERDDQGKINQILIKDDENKLLEDHHWIVQPNGDVRYALTFRTGDGDSDEDFQSIYADVPTEPEAAK